MSFQSLNILKNKIIKEKNRLNVVVMFTVTNKDYI